MVRITVAMAVGCAAVPCGATVLASDAYGTAATVGVGAATAAALVGPAAGQGPAAYDRGGSVARASQATALTSDALDAASYRLATDAVTTRATSSDPLAAGASATVNGLSFGLADQALATLAVTGLLGIAADTVTSTSTATLGPGGDGLSGGTLISGLTLTGTLLGGAVNGGANGGAGYAPAANTVILSLTGLVVTLNEQLRTRTADGATLVTNGIHIAFTDYALNGGVVTGDVFVARSAVAVSGVPEPAAWLLMATGLGLAGGALRRRPRGAASPDRARA